MRSPIRRRSSSPFTISASILTALAFSTSMLDFAHAQSSASCQASWVPTFGEQPGVGPPGDIAATVVFDDGNGPALYAGGGFTSAGASDAAVFAKWNGTEWSSLGNGFDHIINCLAVLDDGSGPALFASGPFTTAGGVPASHIAKWNGSNWSALGGGLEDTAYGLTVFDDGSGPALYACGFFATAGGNPAKNIAKWNGSTWSALGSGLGTVNPDMVITMAIYDDGTGPALYAGGLFTNAGSLAVNHIAKWDGTSWSALGAGLGSGVQRVWSLTVFDDGSGSALYAGGSFSTAGGAPVNNVAKWNGSTWSAVGSGVGGQVQKLTVFDDGSGPALHACGQFATAGGAPANRVARWNGSSWLEVGSGIVSGGMYVAYTMTEFDDGNGPLLYVSGIFIPPFGIPLSVLWTWNGSTWQALTPGLNDSVKALTVFDDGHGPALYACGDFTLVNGGTAKKLAKWNGSIWSSMASDPPYVTNPPNINSLISFDDGSGPSLIIAGDFFTYVAGGVVGKNIEKWNGTNWSLFGIGVSAPVNALAVFDDGSGSALYQGGHSLSKWDGANWIALGGGWYPNSPVWAMTVFDDGGGPALYVGGHLTIAGSVTVNNIAKWNGSNWSALGGGVDSDVRALAVFDDGSGAALYAGGLFSNAGGAPAQHVAKWNGSYWSSLGNGVNGEVDALTSFDDGNGSALYVGGAFTTAGTVTANHIAKWDGTSWSAVGNGTNNSVLALAMFNDSSGPALFAGGSFSNAFDSGDSYLAKWGCSFVKTGTVYCTAATTSHGCVPSISASGTASASATSGFTISVANVEGQRNGIFFYGIHGQLASPWSANSTSLLCVKSPLQRMSVLNSGGTLGQCDGVLSEDWNAFRAAHATALGQPFIRGETVWAQGWFRDPPGLKTTKLSNGLVFAVGP